VWPGVWLKSTYQLADNLEYPGSNRQGYRLKYKSDHKLLQIRASYARFAQIVPSTLSNVTQDGFIDGFFLPQFDDSATLGSQQQYALWIAWHLPAVTITLDYVNDPMRRDRSSAHPEDYVAYRAPQAILTVTRKSGWSVVADAGFGRYAMKGSFAQSYTNVDFFQNVYFLGAQLGEGAHRALLVQLRRSAFAGLPSMLNGASPDYQATTIIVEQRFY